MLAILIQIPLAMLPLLQPPARDCALDTLPPQALEERSMADFAAAVDRYAQVQRRLTRELLASDLFEEEGLFEPDALRTAIVAARPLAREGDLFTPVVARVLRERIDVALLDHPHGAGHILMPRFRPVAGDPGPSVNTTFGYFLGYVKWPSLARALPVLPRELEYAVWGTDLVLVDADTDLVIDILRNALPAGGRPGATYQ